MAMARRPHTKYPSNGLIEEYPSTGSFMAKPKAIYQALAELCVTFEATEKYADEIVPWPLKKFVNNEDARNSPIAPGTMLRPMISIRRKWFDEGTEGIAKIPDAIRQATNRRWERFLKMQGIITQQGALAAARHLQQKVLSDSLPANQTVLYKYTADGAGFITTSLREANPQQQIPVGRRILNVGKKPLKDPTVKDVKKLAAGKTVEGEFRVMEEAESSSTTPK